MCRHLRVRCRRYVDGELKGLAEAAHADKPIHVRQRGVALPPPARYRLQANDCPSGISPPRALHERGRDRSFLQAMHRTNKRTYGPGGVSIGRCATPVTGQRRNDDASCWLCSRQRGRQLELSTMHGVAPFSDIGQRNRMRMKSAVAASTAPLILLMTPGARGLRKRRRSCAARRMYVPSTIP